MEPDFSGWATKAGLKCTDGLTIAAHAFKHQDKTQVPLVWQHGHNDPENVLGHVLLENRDEGVYCQGFFNESTKAKHAKAAIEHGDINSLSIWANDLIKRAKMVLHGAIREVSLVLAGANPGAKIESIRIAHSADSADDEVLEDEALIYTGLELEHADGTKSGDAKNEKTIQDIIDSMTQEQKDVLHYMVGEALAGDSAAQSALTHHAVELGDDPTVQAVYDSMTKEQKDLLHDMLGQAVTEGQAKHSGTDENKDGKTGDKKGTGTEVETELKHNIFEQAEGDKKTLPQKHVLSHDAIKSIVDDAKDNTKSLKAAVESYAIAHGINDIDVLFPEAKALTDAPEFISRRVEWVSQLLGAVRKSPFSRIKTTFADITVQEARAKGYIKGTLKKEEFFGVARRVTTPTTIYKKQKLDRDDIIDITDFDVVVWLKGEMRIMLDEEIARAILVGDGRAVDDEDKINEDHIRPVATDHEVYTTTLNVPMDETPALVSNAIDQIALNRSNLRGSGTPTMYTTERYLARMLLLKDNTGRKLYRNVDELRTDLRVNAIVTVEVLEEYPDIFAILFNPMDYVVGADKGGQVSMFDDFDIDYNQYKYLIETRCSGALVKYKAAMVVRTAAGNAVAVAPAEPLFDGTEVTIVDTANVVYRNQDTDAIMTAALSPYPVAEGDTLNVHAEPAGAGFYIPDEDDADWAFRNNG